MGPAFVSEYQASRGQNRYQRADGAKGAFKEKERKKGKIRVVNTVRTRRNSSNKVGNSTVQKIMYCHTVKILDADDFETFVIPFNHPPLNSSEGTVSHTKGFLKGLKLY